MALESLFDGKETEEPFDLTRRITPDQGRLFVVSGPSGVGKGTVIREAMSRTSGATPLMKCITATTREPRAGEINGQHYHFFSRAEFELRIDQGFFLEHASYNDNLYGTPAESVRFERSKGRDVLLEIEVQGGLAVRDKAPDAVLIFLAPPSWEVLADRLLNRATESRDVAERRLKIARQEMQAVSAYHYCIVNDALDDAVEALRAIVIAERHRILKAEF